MKVFISIGSNLGDRTANCERSLELLARTAGITLINRSRTYETTPWGVAGQPDFINACAQLETSLSPGELLAVARGIEAEMGRVETYRWGPRSIDVDVLLYGDAVVDEEALSIPHPRMHERLFVLEPLCEIAPMAIHPILKKSVRQLLYGLSGELPKELQAKGAFKNK
ncbi:MAG: 2-amino-4-hydroxy-6-hydroxymethyldihydropteridine diphosphokinase [Nitrospirae bacterium]|nr:2-amino-4-hydroxy-6-hydroxymethyldihydropteridine diphosphokinase [Nitrospirota bacterium]